VSTVLVTVDTRQIRHVSNCIAVQNGHVYFIHVSNWTRVLLHVSNYSRVQLDTSILYACPIGHEYLIYTRVKLLFFGKYILKKKFGVVLIFFKKKKKNSLSY
jgi:hypothetical protein